MKFLVKRCIRNQIIFAVGGLVVAGWLIWTLAKILTPDSPGNLVQGSAVEESTAPHRNAEQRKKAITQYLATKYHQKARVVRKYVDLAWRESAKHRDVPPELLLGIMTKESSLLPEAKSGYGAEGLMQVVRRCHPEKLNKHESLLDPNVNIRVGAKILQQYITQEGQLERALVKYSGNATGYADFVIKETKTLQSI